MRLPCKASESVNEGEQVVFEPNRQAEVRAKEKQRYDVKARGKCFEVGDRVLLFNPAVKMGQNRKFAPCYMGPYTITEQLAPTTYRISPDNENDKVQIVHQNRLKRFLGD